MTTEPTASSSPITTMWNCTIQRRFRHSAAKSPFSSILQIILFVFLLCSPPLCCFAQQFVNAQQYDPHRQQHFAQTPQRRSVSTDIQQQSAGRTITSPVIKSSASNREERARVHGYLTDQRVPRQTDCSAPAGQCQAGDGTGYNGAALSGGIPGAAGIKARLNSRGFQYLSSIAGGVLNYMIKRTRLPNISQCISQLNGCVNVYNLYVSRYRCPSRVTVYPAPPNQIVLDVQNLDIGVTGNLGGQIVILLPLALFGIVQVNLHNVNVRVSVTIGTGYNGGVALRMASCAVSVGYVDVYIQNGGLIGDIANSQFRGKISEMVREQIPSQLCQRLPQILDEQINTKLSSLIPQKIPVSQLLQIALKAFGLDNLVGGGQCAKKCAKKKAAAAAAPKVNATIVVPQHSSREEQTKLLASSSAASQEHEEGNNRTATILRPSKQHPAQEALAKGNVNGGGSVNSGKTLNHHRLFAVPNSAGGPTVLINSGAVHNHSHLMGIRQWHVGRGVVAAAIAPLAPHAHRPIRSAAPVGPKQRKDRATPSDSGRLSFVDQGENYCENCPNTGQQDSPLAMLAVVLQSMDLSKLNNIFLNVQILNTYATNHDFTIELNGEFSVCGRGCTPFGPFPMQFSPCSGGCKMVEILISDYTINSLLYHMHNVGFLVVRIGPETPKIGELLRTTCSTGGDEDESGGGTLEDHGVEAEDGSLVIKHRRRRQEASDLASLGICLGDILPAVRERYPNEQVFIVISTERAPSVILSSRNGGTATLDIVVNADFYIQSSGQKVGTIRIATVADITVRPQGDRISAHADIRQLQLQDVGNQLGLPQDALDNLGTLGKDIILKAGNDALSRGASLNLPPGLGGLPVSIANMELHFLEHALLIQADFTLNPSALGGYEPC